MPYTVDEIARVCHEANRALQAVQNDPGVPVAAPWVDFEDQRSVVDGVRKALDGATPEELHESWCEHKRADGWTYGPVKDAAAKTHPCLVPYAELPAEQRDKDALFAAVVDALGDVAPRPLRLDERHPSVAAVLRYLEVNPNLPGHLALVASTCRALAVGMADSLPPSPELTAGLRKLLEAKDCFVRAAL